MKCYWAIQQKSLITGQDLPVAKVRPIVSHSVHPMRVGSKRVARALAVLVQEARQVVMEKWPSHLPMWQLHSGSREWLARIARTGSWWGSLEYDVSDCFLNTPREAVMESVSFWLGFTESRSRRQRCFAISKDGKRGDHRGQPASIHYWAVTSEQLISACQWELEENATFEAMDSEG